MKSSLLSHLPFFHTMISFPQSLFNVKLQSLMAILSLILGCQRPTLGGVQTLDCGIGDRLVSLSRVYCIYDQETQGHDLMAGMTMAGSMMGGSLMSGREDQPAVSLPIDCPDQLPYEYQFSGLTICSREGMLSPNVIEAVAAQWVREFGVRNMSSSNDTIAGMEGMAGMEGIVDMAGIAGIEEEK